MASSQPICTNQSGQITAIDRMDTNDLTAKFSMRYRKAGDPDVDASYQPVVTTKTTMGITYPFFDIANMPPDTYVVHTYAISSGTATGTKVTIEVICDDVIDPT